MFTLKIKWFRHESGEGIVDESTLFVPADEVHYGAEILDHAVLHAWEDGTYLNYGILANVGEDHDYIGGTKMVQVIRENRPDVWYLVSLAWLLGPDGKTIERLTT